VCIVSERRAMVCVEGGRLFPRRAESRILEIDSNGLLEVFDLATGRTTKSVGDGIG
jgi:hypothetical protein